LGRKWGKWNQLGLAVGGLVRSVQHSLPREGKNLKRRFEVLKLLKTLPAASKVRLIGKKWYRFLEMAPWSSGTKTSDAFKLTASWGESLKTYLGPVLLKSLPSYNPIPESVTKQEHITATPQGVALLGGIFETGTSENPIKFREIQESWTQTRGPKSWYLLVTANQTMGSFHIQISRSR